MDRITVVGNGVAGWACAKRLAEGGAPVTLIGPGLPHDRPPLSKRALGSGRIPWSTSPEGLAELGIRHIDGIVTAVDFDERVLTIASSADDGTEPLDFGPLVWATGFAFPRPPVDGLDHGDVHQNHEAVGTLRLHERLTASPQRVLVVGAGLIGTETAASAAAMGHEVTLVDMLPRPLSRLPLAAGDAAAAILADLGITFIGDCRIDAVDHDGDGVTLRTATHGDIAGDTVVLAAGCASTLPADLTPDRGATVDVDETLQVIGQVDVWACGDCITFPHPRWGRIAIPHWDHALNSGRHVAAAILGADDPYVRDPYWFSDIGPLRMQLVGYADAVASWDDEDGMLVGRASDGRVAAILLINAPARLNEARDLMAVASTTNV